MADPRTLLRRAIEWVSGINKASPGGEKSFQPANRFGDRAVLLAGLKLAL